MNALEMIAIEKLIQQLREIKGDLFEDNAGRMEHLRPLILGKVVRTIETATAIQENSKP